jgi:asparagine synthase (glutamine-hydrolysing)
MCGIAGMIGPDENQQQLRRMLSAQAHRGPDATGLYEDISFCCLGHNRLSIIDLSSDGNQPMTDITGRYVIVFNGELYNYMELKKELSEFIFRSKSDTEVLLAAYAKWGKNCLPKLIGMFSFAIWDTQEKFLFAVRDRFGVKPFYYTYQNETLLFSSEIKTLWAGGVKKEMNTSVWASYFAYSSYGSPQETFWNNIHQLPGGHFLSFSQAKGLEIKKWYSFEENVAALSIVKDEDKQAYYEQLLRDAVSLRFRADVPIGFNLSGGLDSSVLLSMVDSVHGTSYKINAFTFTCGDERYDELPWVKNLLSASPHPLIECKLAAHEVPALAAEVSRFQDEPYGGIPTVAYSNIFKQARKQGVIVLLDGQGMDEAWAGYDYYTRQSDSLIQGTSSSTVRPHCFEPDFIKLAYKPLYPSLFADPVMNLQFRDLFFTKIPRALRFNDRISMMYSTELREPFLDHRLVEFAFAQPASFKLKNGQQKWMLREIAAEHLHNDLVMAPKRPVQTPQREWLANDLRDWANTMIENFSTNNFVSKSALKHEWETFTKQNSDNSFYVWQWIDSCLLLSN